jgi:hypothetical protein
MIVYPVAPKGFDLPSSDPTGGTVNPPLRVRGSGYSFRADNEVERQ